MKCLFTTTCFVAISQHLQVLCDRKQAFFFGDAIKFNFFLEHELKTQIFFVSFNSPRANFIGLLTNQRIVVDEQVVQLLPFTIDIVYVRAIVLQVDKVHLMVRFEVGFGLLVAIAELQHQDCTALINDGVEPVKGSEKMWQWYCLERLSILVLAVIKQTDFNRLTVLVRMLLGLLFFIFDSDEKTVTDLLDILRLSIKDVPVFGEVGPGELLFLLEVGHLE